MDTVTRAELIRQYANGPAVLRTVWDETPSDVRLYRPAPNEWSAREIICHCADSELNAAIRIRMLAAEPNPTIIGYDQNEWVRIFDYHDLNPELALAAVEAARAWTVPILERFAESQWAAIGIHSESGPYSALDWLRTYSVHLHDHAEQIRANVRAWNAREYKDN